MTGRGTGLGTVEASTRRCSSRAATRRKTTPHASRNYTPSASPPRRAGRRARAPSPRSCAPAATHTTTRTNHNQLRVTTALYRHRHLARATREARPTCAVAWLGSPLRGHDHKLLISAIAELTLPPLKDVLDGGHILGVHLVDVTSLIFSHRPPTPLR